MVLNGIQIVRHPAQKHKGNHDHMLCNRHSICIGIAQQAIRVCKNPIVPAIEIHSRRRGTIPPQSRRSGTQQLRRLGIKDFAMLQMFLCLFKLPGCKIAHMHLRSPGSGVDPLPVRLCQKILKNTNISFHALPAFHSAPDVRIGSLLQSSIVDAATISTYAIILSPLGT